MSTLHVEVRPSHREVRGWEVEVGTRNPHSHHVAHTIGPFYDEDDARDFASAVRTHYGPHHAVYMRREKDTIDRLLRREGA